jgi:hypothetical protein
MDEHVPKPITVGLRVRGVDALTAQEDHHRATDDDILLDRAAELGRVMFSFDEDMLQIANQWQREGRNFTGEDLPGEDMEYIEWAGEAEMLSGLQRELDKLENARLPQHWLEFLTKF